MTFSHKPTFKFRVEGLEPRILLSAVPVDGEVQSLEEPLFSDSVFVLDTNEANTQGASAAGSAESAEGDLYADSIPLNEVDEVFLSGALEAGLLVEADIIHIADGTVLNGVQLSAGAIHIGAATWSGDNTVLADRLRFLTDQSAEEGATLILAPRSVDAAIALGFEDTGFSLNAEEMAALVAAGMEQLTIGLEDGAHDVSVDGLSYEGNLLLRSPEDGGEFYILSQINHSGGTLAYEGSGQTQNTSADTITSGADILVNDSLNLVYTEDNENSILFDTTGDNNPQGADILISGDILGTDFGNGGTLYLNAGTTGNIVIQGGVGTLEALGSIVILNAHDVTFEGNIILESFDQKNGTGSSTFGATASNFVLTGGGDFIVNTTNNVTFGGDVESATQNVEITVDPFSTSGKVWFKGDVNIDNGDLIVHSAKDFEITGSAEINGALQQDVGASESIFRSAVEANTIDLFAQQRIRFLSTVTLLEGDMKLVADEIDFEGGAGSIIGAQDADGIGISRLFLRPTAASVSMDIGDPTGGVGTFELSSVDIAALADGFALITIGYDPETGATSTNAVRIGGAAFLDALEVYGGSFIVNGSFSARTSLLVEADSGLINITSAQVRVRNEQVDNVWQSSELTLLAHTGDIETANGASLLIDNEHPTDTAEGSTINLIATLGSVVNQANSFGFIEARDLNVEAGQSITVLTDVETVSARSTDEGDIQIDELGELHVIRAITANGKINLSTGGDTVVDLLESQTDAIANRIGVEVFGGNLHVDRMLAGTLGSVQLDVEGEVTGFSQTDRSSLLDAHIVGNILTLNAQTGLGEALNPLQISANKVAATNSDSGLVHLQQDDNRAAVEVAIDNQSSLAGDYVAFTVLAGDTAVTTVTTVDEDDLPIASLTGIQAASAAGVLIDVAGSLAVDADVNSEGGPLTVRAVDTIQIAAGISLESNGGDASFTSLADLSMAVDASVLTNGGSLAADVGGDMLLGVLDASVSDDADRDNWGDVALRATGYIQDHSASAVVNVSGRSLQMNAGTTIGQIPAGSNEQALEVDVLTLAAASDAGVIVIQSIADLTVGEVAAFSPDVLSADGSIVTGPQIATLAGILNSGGGDVLVASAEDLSAADSIVTSGTGRIVLIGDSLTIEDAITSSGGALSLAATNDLTLGDAADVDTNGAGEILVTSDSGSILAAAGSEVNAETGSILFAALDNITLGAVATAGDLGLKATNGSILAASGGLATRRVVTSDTLTIVSGDSVAGANGSTDALLTDVNTISLSGGTGAVYNLSNDGTLTVDTTSVSVTRYSSLLVETTVAIVAQSDLSVAGEGHLSVNVTNSGDFELAATREISTTGAGTILLDVAGALTMGEASHLYNQNGAITLNAGNSVSVAQVSSDLGNISVTSAAGAIIDVDPAQVTVDFETAGQLTLNASTGIGIDADDQLPQRQTLSVLLGTLAASTTTGGIYIGSSEGFATNGVTSVTSGTISLLSDGAITVGPSDGGVAINSAEDLVLRAGAELTQLSGNTIEAADDISLYGSTEITLSSVTTTGNVALESNGAVMGYAEPTVAAITAQGLLLDGIGSMGTPTQRLSLDVAVLAGTVELGTLAFDNAQSLSLDSVSVNTREVAPMGTLPTVLRLQTGDTVILDDDGLIGDGLFATIDGDLNASSAGVIAAVAVTQALPVLWETTGAQTWSGLLNLAGGDSTLRATGAIEMTTTGGFASSGGDLSVEAGDDFTLSSGASMDLGSGALLVNSENSVIIEGQVITTGAVALIADDSIHAGTAGGALRVSASDLLLTAGHGIGSEVSMLTTAVDQISAAAGAAGIYINNTGAVRVTNLGLAVTSFAADRTSNVAFSGFQGGIQTQLSGAIQFDNTGAVTVDPVKSEIQVFPGAEFEFALLLNDAGPDGNAVSVIFEVIREDGDTIDADEDENTQDLRNGNPPSTFFNETSQVLRVFVRNDVSTIAQILDAINADPDFDGSAVLATGPSDGSAVFSLGTSAENAFFAENGAHEGIVAYSAGTTDGGADPIAAYAEIQPADALYAIRVTSTNPGAAANDFEVRLLDDGPGGNLTDATNSALVEWDEPAGLLNVYVNFGYTTAGEIIDAINSAEAEIDGAPFTAAFSGAIDPADVDDVIGDASVLMVSNLSAETTIRSVGADNDFKVISSAPGPLYNGISFRFVDDGLVATQGVRASFDDVANVMSIFIDSAVTQANDVIAALNTEGTFIASLTPELTTANNGTGVIQATRFALRDGAVAVNASVTVGMAGSNNDFVVTANEPGDDQNAIEVILVSDSSITPGAAITSFSELDGVLEIRINPDFATPGGIMTAINSGPNAASIPFTASLPEGTTGFGGIALATHSKTTGGTGSVARAVVNAFGDDNGFEVVADSDSTLLQNITVFIIDDGSIDDGSAVASYLADSRALILNVQNGVTTANTLLAEINSAEVPVSATLAGEADGSGTFGNESQPFVNGADPIVATLTTVLPSDVEVQLAATIGGVINNGIQVSYALDASLTAGTASATLFEADGLRLLQVRFADATTTLRALQDFFDANPELPFEVANIAAVEAEVVGELAPQAVDGYEGAISLSASGPIRLLARVTSQTGSVSVTTTDSGNLSFDSATASLSSIDGITLDLDGALINNESLESPLLKVYDASLLRIETGALQDSTKSIRLETNGNVEIDGAGLNLAAADFTVAAAGTVEINSAITATGATTIFVDAGDTFTLTASGSLLAETITLLSGNEAVLSGSVDAGSFSLTADAEIRQSGTIDSVDAITVTSIGGAILMSGDGATTSAAGAILYTADGEMTVTSVVSTDGGDISLISGAAISNVRETAGTNVSTSGEVILTAVSGVGQIGNAIRVESGTLSLNNSGATGDIVVTESTAGADLVISALTQSATAGRSVLISEDGNVHFTGSALHTGTGAMLVDSAGSILTDALATLTLGGGELTLRAVTDVSLMADAASNGGDVYIDAGAALLMASDITLSAGGGDVALLADGNVEVAQVLSLLAGVYIASANGSVLRSANDGRTNVLAGRLQLFAGTDIGSLTTIDDAMIIEVDRLTATAQTGVLAIDSINDLSVGETTVEVDYAKADGTTDASTWTTDQLRTDAGNAVLRGRGALTFETITDGPTVEVAGNALISAVGVLQLDGDTLVSVGSAHLSSVDTFTLNGDFSLTDTGTVLLETDGDFSQAATSSILTNNQDAIISSTGAMSISSVDAGSGDLALTAGGAITRLSTAPATQLISNALRLSSGGSIASVVDPLVVDVVTLTAAATGGIRLNSDGSVEVNSVFVTTDTVSTTGVTSVETARTEATQSDISSSAGGDVLLQFAGHLILQDGDNDERAVGTNGDGRIFLGAASLDAYAAIRSLDGDITLAIDGGAHWISVAESAQGAGDATTAGVLAQTGDIFIRTGDDLLMDEGGYIRANSGNIGIDVTGSLTVGSVEAALGYVHLQTTGAILDGGDAAIDLIANRLQIQAGTGAGLLGAAAYNPLEISVNRLSAQITSGPLALVETNDVQIGLTEGSVNQLDLDGVASVALNEGDALFGINIIGTGSATLVASGTITAMAALAETPDLATIRISDTGDLLLHANATGASVTINGDIDASGGSLTLSGTAGVSLDSDVTVVTDLSGTLTVLSSAGGLTMGTGSTLSATLGDIVVNTSGMIAVAGIETAGKVALTSSTSSITDNEAARTNVTAGTLYLNTNSDIGASTNAFDTEVDTLSARTADGSLYLLEVDSLDIGATQATSGIVAANGVVTPTLVVEQSGVVTGGSNGNVIITLSAGDLAVLSSHIVSAAGTGRILLDTPGELSLSAEVSSNEGSITLLSSNDFSLAAGIEVTTGGVGQIHLTSGGVLLAAADSRFVASTGNIALTANGNLILGGASTEGRVALISETGHIRAAGSTAFDLEVLASYLLLRADNALNGGIGTLAPAAVQSFRTQVGRVAAIAGAEGIHLINSEGLTVGSVLVSTSKVTASGGLEAQADLTLSDLTTIAGSASIVLRTTSGSITLNEGGDLNGASVVAHGAGNVLLSAANDLTANASVLSTSGHLTLRAVNTLTLVSGSTIGTAASGTIFVQSTDGMVTMGGTAIVRATASSVLVDAEGTVTVGVIEGSSVAVESATGSILRASGSATNITATDLILAADTGVASATAPLSIDVDGLAASTRAGGLFLLESSDAVVGANVTVTVSEVTADSSATLLPEKSLGGLNTSVDGAIILVSTAGSLEIATSASVIAATSGRIRIEAATDLTVNADVQSGTGHLSLIATDGISFGDVSVTTGGSADVYIDAGSGALTQVASTTTSAGANVRLAAVSDVTLGSVSGVAISVLSGGNILAALGSLDNLSATSLRLNAGSGIGAGSRHLTTAVAELSALAQDGSIFITESDDVTVTSVAVVTNQVSATAIASTQTDLAQADLRSGGNGDIVLVSLAGDITLNDGNSDDAVVVADGSGSALVTAAGDLNINSGIASGSGDISLGAGNNLILAGVSVTTTSGDISLSAIAGEVTMPATATLTTTTGNLRISAQGNATVGQLSADAVSLRSDSGSLLSAEFSTINVTADSLRLFANAAIGAADHHLLTDVAKLSAHSSTDGIFITESTAITVTSVRVETTGLIANGGSLTVTDAAQSDLTAGAAIVLVVNSGDLTLEDGSALIDQTSGDGRFTNTIAVQAGGSGGLLLDAQDGQLVANASILATTGNVTVRASGSVSINGSSQIATTGAGDLSVESEQGALTFASTASVSGAASVRLASETDLTVGAVSGASVSLQATTGAILNDGGSVTEVLASSGLRLSAAGSIGAASNHLRTDAAVLSARSSGGALFLTDSSSTTVASVRVETTEFTATAGDTVVVDAAQSDLVTLNNGDIILVLTSGDLTLNDGTTIVNQAGGDARSADGSAVEAHGAGRIYLQAAGALTANADILSSTGLVTIQAEDLLTLETGVTIQSGADISLRSNADAILMDGTVDVIATGSVLRVAADDALTLGNLTGTTVSLVAGGAINNAVGSTLNVSADALRISALGAIGSAARHLTVDVATLAAYSENNGLFLTAQNAVTVAPVASVVSELTSSAGSTTVNDDALNHLTALNDGAIVLQSLAGSIEVPNVISSGSGAVLLSSADELSLTGSLDSGSGAVTVLSQNAITLGLGTSILSSTNGSVLIESANGAFTMSGNATIMAANAGVGIHADGDITLGVMTGDVVSLISSDGGIRRAATVGTSIVANSLRIDAFGSVGTLERAFTAYVDLMSIAASSVHLLSINGTTVGTVGLTLDRLLSDLSTETVEDVALSGVVTTSGGLIDIRTIGGDLNLSATAGVITAGAAGDVLLTIDGDFDAGAAITSVSGTLTLNISGSGSLDATMSTTGDISISSGSHWAMSGTSVVSGALVSIDSGADLTLGNVSGTSVDIDAGAKLLSATGSTRNVSATIAASLLARDGMGATSSNYNVSVEAPILTVENLTAGSAFLLLSGTTRVDQLDLNNSGSLQLNASGGDLDLAGGVALGTGSAIIRVNGALELGEAITANGDIKLTAQSLDIDAGLSLVNPLIESFDRSIELRVSGDLSLPAGAILRAAQGDIKMTVGGELSLPVVFAEGVISIRGNSNVVAAGIGTAAHLLTAESIQLLAGADLGASGQPIVTQAVRLDAQASGTAEVVELNDLEIGRYGLRLQDAANGDTFTLHLNNEVASTLSSVNGVVNVDGDFVVRSEGEVTLQTRLINDNGDIFLEVGGLQFALAGAEPVFTVENGLLDLDVGAAGVGTGLSLSAAQLTALVESGDFTALINGSSQVTVDGIILTDTTGKVTLTVDGGDFTLGGVVVGAGGIQIDIPDGGLRTTASIVDAPALVAGDQTIKLELGTGASGSNGDAIVTASLNFSAATDSGDLNLEFRPSGSNVVTNLVDQGLTIRSGGVGNISLLVSGHNLDFDANVEHAGFGSVTLDVESGGLEMYAGSSILVNSGTLNLSARDFLVVNYIENLIGSTFIDSALGLIVRNTAPGTSTINFRGAIGPVITLNNSINLLMDVDSAMVNGILFERFPGDDFLFVSGSFQ